MGKQNYIIATAPTLEPITLEEAKDHLRLTSDFLEDDNYITLLIKAARKAAENYTSRAFLNTTFDLYQDEFFEEIEIGKGNISEVTSINYNDVSGDPQSLDLGLTFIDLNNLPALLKSTSTFPSTYSKGFNNVTIRFVAGFGATAAEVPEDIKTALKLIIARWYDNREDTRQNLSFPKASECLLNEYKLKSGI